MGAVEKEKFEFTCHNPKCNKPIEVEYRAVWNGTREVRCPRCRTKHQFDSGLASRARSAASDVDRAQQTLDREMKELEKAIEAVTAEKVQVTVG